MSATDDIKATQLYTIICILGLHRIICVEIEDFASNNHTSPQCMTANDCHVYT